MQITQIHPHMLTSLSRGHVTIFRDKTTLKMAAESVIQFSDHVRYKDMSDQHTRYVHDQLSDFVTGRDKGP